MSKVSSQDAKNSIFPQKNILLRILVKERRCIAGYIFRRSNTHLNTLFSQKEKRK